MQNLLKISIFSAICLSIALGFFALNIILPQRAHEELQAYITATGITEEPLPQPQMKMLGLYYTDIKLDPDGINTIDHLHITYTLTGLLKDKRFASITLNGAYFDVEPKTLLQNSKEFSRKTLPKLPFDTLNIKNATLAMFFENVGAITLKTEAQVQNREHLEIHADITTEQKPLSAHVKMDGTIHDMGYALDFELDRAKIDFPEYDLKMTRINAQGKVLADLGSHPALTAEIQAGGATYQDTPWQNVSMTLEKDERTINFLSTARSIGTEGIEAQLDTIIQLNTFTTLQKGSIFAPKAGMIHAYFDDIPAIPEDLHDVSNLNIQFVKPDEQSFYYSIFDGPHEITLKGQSAKDFTVHNVVATAFEKLANSTMSDQSKSEQSQ